MNASDPLSLNLYTYCCNNPVMYVDPSGCLTIAQYPNFILKVGIEGLKITAENLSASAIWNVIQKVTSSVSAIYTVGKALVSNEISINNLISVMGQSVWDGLSGDLRYLINNYTLFDPNTELTDSQLDDLATRTAGAYEETVQFATILHSTVKLAKKLVSVSKTYKWGNSDTLIDHYNRHGADFNAKSYQDYAKKANSFYNNRSKYQVKIDNDGIIRVYDPQTNSFGSYNADGTTKTFFKPSGRQSYFDRQPGK